MQLQIQPPWLDLVREFPFFLFLLMYNPSDAIFGLGMLLQRGVLITSPGRGLYMLSSEKERKEKVIIQEVGDFGMCLPVYVLLSFSVYIYSVRKIQYR